MTIPAEFSNALIFCSAIAAGAVASVAGFGIGSILTPLVALTLGAKSAVVAVTIPHAVGTTLRLWMLRAHINRNLLLHFGLMSAIGGLCGAILHTCLISKTLAILLACLLLFVGITGLLGISDRLRFGHRTAWLAGIASGALGGLVGNQGGIRSAAMLGFDLSKEAFVGTATAIALLVDSARLPIYLVCEGKVLTQFAQLISLATCGVVIGTLFGTKILRLIPERTFRQLLSLLILTLAVLTLYQSI